MIGFCDASNVNMWKINKNKNKETKKKKTSDCKSSKSKSFEFNTTYSTYFFLLEVSDSGGMPKTMTVPFSTSIGAAIMSGNSLQRLFRV